MTTAKRLWLLATAAALAGAGLSAATAQPVPGDVRAGIDAWAAQDYDQAVQIWRPLADRGDADAQYNLAQAYFLGRGVPQNMTLAEQWYARAARQGHPEATANYGLLLFQNGRRQEAIPFITRAADAGDPRAQYVLGTALFNGDVVTRDAPRAYALMSRAAAANLPPAVTQLTEMERLMSPQDRARGVELARECAPRRRRRSSPPGPAPAPAPTPSRTADSGPDPAAAHRAGADAAGAHRNRDAASASAGPDRGPGRGPGGHGRRPLARADRRLRQRSQCPPRLERRGRPPAGPSPRLRPRRRSDPRPGRAARRPRRRPARLRARRQWLLPGRALTLSLPVPATPAPLTGGDGNGCSGQPRRTQQHGLALAAPADVRADRRNPCPAALRQVSASGAFLETNARPMLGARVELHHPDAGAIEAEVSSLTHDGVGLAFRTSERSVAFALAAIAADMSRPPA